MDSQQNSSSTKEQILNAAFQLFMSDGDGVSTQQIADRAEVNKAMLYYYFDSKENLYNEVFRKAVRESGLQMFDILKEDLPLFEKIRKYIYSFIDNLLYNGQVASFVLTGLNQNPKLVTDILMDEIRFDSSNFTEQLKEAADRYEIARVDARQLITNIISLTVFPIANRNYFMELFDFNSEQEYSEFLEKRKGIVYDMTMNWLTK